jgi:hypothetical protein
MKKLLIILGAISLVLILVYFFFFKGVSLIWSTYKSPKVSFSFKYPSNWFICEEFYPNQNTYFVHATDKKVTCGELNTAGQVDIDIEDGKISTSEKDIQVYLNNAEKQSNSEEEKNIAAGGVPTTPGFMWHFESYAGSLFGLSNTAAARVSGLAGEPNFVLLMKGKVYNVIVSSEAGLNNLPSRILLYTLRAI